MEFEEKLTLLDQLQSQCTHCGLCSEGCATYQSTGWEHESPRGRLQLAARFLQGDIPLKSEALSTFDHCLGCQGCEPLCPLHVPYHQVRQIIQDIRRDLKLIPSVTMESSRYEQWINLAYRISSHWWRRYGAKWLTIPSLLCRSNGSYAKQKRMKKDQPILISCCVHDLFQHDVIEQTLLFVQRLGETLQVDRKQPCCGAIFNRLVEGGEESICYSKKQKKVADMQMKARKEFLKWIPSQSYFLSRGCQCVISQAENQERDLYAWIENLLIQKEITLYFPQTRTVYYQPYCKSLKGGEDSIWRLLRRIQGLMVREINYPQACCGGYCGETLLHPERAQKIAMQKIKNLPPSTTLVVTSPDCWGLFKSFGSDQNLNICYPIQILLEAQLHKSGDFERIANKMIELEL